MSIVFFRRFKTAIACSCIFFLAGCASVNSLFSDPLKPVDGKEDLTLTGTGVQLFQCTADRKGRYWKFVSPKITMKDAQGKVIAEQGADFTIKAPDGSVLTAKIVKWSDKQTAGNARDVLFATKARGKTGILSEYRWVKRMDNRGGSPQTRCSPSQLGTLLQLPFSAKYVFYK